MSMRICPKCSAVFYTMNQKGYEKCYHCGFVLTTCRSIKRVQSRIGFTFSHENAEIFALLRDYSEGGARIVFAGMPLPLHAVITLHIHKLMLDKSAVVVWTKRDSINNTSAGLKFL